MKSFKNFQEFKKSSSRERVFKFIPENIYTKIPIKENKDKIVDFEVYCKENNLDVFIDLVWEKKDIKKCFLRYEVAERLYRAWVLLKKQNKNFTFRITDAFRPIKLQKRIFKEIYSQIKEKTRLKGEALYLEVTKYVADPKNVPPHSTGGAVDLTIFDIKKKKDINMGTKIDSVSPKSATFAKSIRNNQRKNRKILFGIMMKSGFVNSPTEWWHYSYGDQYWAAVSGKKFAKYNSK